MPLVSKTFSQIITFTRASTATYFDSAGVLQSAAIDAPRFDFSPATLAAQGLLIEEQRTNGIRNNTMQGAAAGTPGTAPTNWFMTTTGGVVTRTIVGTGTESGITYIEVRYQFSGAGSATILPEPTTQVAATTGQTWTSSAYVKLIAGGYTNLTTNIDVNESDAGGTFLNGSSASYTATTAGLATQRASLTRALNQATTAFVATNFRLAATGAADITLRIGLPQLEQGAFATSVIPTTTTALTRSEDRASVNTLSPWFNSTASTLYAEWTNIAAAIPTGVTQLVTEIAELTNLNFYRIFQSQAAGAKASSNMFSGGVNPGRLDSGGAYSNATVKVASAFAASDRAISANGAVATTSATGALPVGVTALFLGQQAGSTNFLNGYLRRVSYFPRRLSNAELQSLTA